MQIVAQYLPNGADSTPEELVIDLESISPRWGQVGIAIPARGICWKDSWRSMPYDCVLEFFSKAPTEYLVDNMAGVSKGLPDYLGFKEKTLTKLMHMRRNREFERSEASSIYEMLSDSEYAHQADPKALAPIWGPDWWYAISMTPNPAYAEAMEIIDVAQKAVATYLEKSHSTTQ